VGRAVTVTQAQHLLPPRIAIRETTGRPGRGVSPAKK